MQNIKLMFKSPRFLFGFIMIFIIVSYAIWVPVFNTANPKEDRAPNPVYDEVQTLKALLDTQDEAKIQEEIAKLRGIESAELEQILNDVEYKLVEGPMENAVSATGQLKKRKQPLVYGELDALGELLSAKDLEAAEAEETRLIEHCEEAVAFGAEMKNAAAAADFEAAAALVEGYLTKTDNEVADLNAAIAAQDAAALTEAADAFVEQVDVMYGWVKTVRERLETPGYADAAGILTGVQPTILIPKNTAPNGQFWFGTDNFGRDIFLEMAYGARASLLIGLVAGCVATLIGIGLGLAAGFIGGKVDNVINAFTNTFIVIPSFIILVLISIAVGTIRDGVLTGVIIGLTSWPWTARAVRAQTTSLRNRDHVNMARITGYSTAHIIVTEILPYVASYVVMAFILQMASGIGSESTLAILGLADPTGLSLGRMLNWALNYDAIVYGRWWQFIPVSVAIGMTTFGLYMMNSGMDEVFNPKIRS